MKKISKKQIIYISLASAAFIIVVLAVVIINQKTSDPGYTYFTKEPEQWIENNDYSDDTSDVFINIKKATRDLSRFNGLKQDIYYFGKLVTFFSHGYYDGIQFEGIYVDPSVIEKIDDPTIEEMQKLLKESIKIQITNNLDPNNGVIEGMILGKIENDDFVFYLFVDEDWKEQLEYTNILWGKKLDDENTLNIRPFDFSNEFEGIFIDKIDYDVDWFKTNSNGGIFLGEINMDTLKINEQKDLNSTFIYIQ
ncbi:MAG: hypothetical protein KKF44_00190 [Nanoarchaeota archaeon]|nr:hypothetical protein [Nanoarchaeota archaeon]